MKKNNVISIKSPTDALTELLKTGARQLIKEAVECELNQFLSDYDERLPDNKRRVVRNGYLPAREIMTGIGGIDIQLPRLRDRSDAGKKIQFRSSLIPPYMRRTGTLDEVLPLLYLKGISEADFVEVLSPIFGVAAKNLSPGVISRLKSGWESQYEAWSKRQLEADRYVYWWVDGIYFPVRGDEKRCVLVIVGVNTEGVKELIALSDGFRESTESWLSLLRELRDRGLTAPALAVGDGALGFWKAVSQVYPEGRHQRCWFHKMGNVLDKLPKSQQGQAKLLLREIWMSASRQDAQKAMGKFVSVYEAKYPKATKCLLKDKEALLAFYDFPAEHWAHLRTTNPIESTFATVRHRTHKVKGAFSNKTTLLMVFKLMESASKRWQRLRGFHHLDNVIRGVKFVDGHHQMQQETMSEENQQEKRLTDKVAA